MTTRTIQWSQPSQYSVTGVHHGYRTAPGTYHDLDGELGGVVKVWFGMLEPGGFIVPHIDASPWYRRRHYPMEAAGFIWQNGVTVEAPTEPFEVSHWEPHAVWNPTGQRRVHLIAETSERLPGASDLVLCDMLPEIQELIDAL